jgi:transposase
MHEATSVLFGLDGFRVIDVERVDDNLLRVVVETVDRHGACPGCGQVSSRVKQRPRVRIRDLPVGDSEVQL